MPGQLLGDRYQVEKQLGKQSGRWTLLAQDLVTQNPVILKILCIDDESTETALTLFQREVEILQMLEHPNIPRYLGYFEVELPKSGKALVLIQNYLVGQSLQTYLNQGRRFDQPEVKQIAQSILKTLIYIHEQNPPILHRDIKPSNILLTGSPTEPTQGQICLIDFGSVRLAANELTAAFTTTQVVVGTDGYMPPEQLGRRAVKASDLYGLGISLVVALTGLPPEHLPRHGLRIGVAAAITTCSPEFVQWLSQMTEPELPRRFDQAQTALAALEAIA